MIEDKFLSCLVHLVEDKVTVSHRKTRYQPEDSTFLEKMVCQRVDHVLVSQTHKDRELGPDWMDLHDPYRVKMRTGGQGGGLEQKNDQFHVALP